MPISQEKLNRIVKLHGIIEGHKEHSHAAPTYKDSPYLAEMAQIALAPRDHDIETLEEIIPTLWYLTECYDKMCRAGMSVKFYTPQLQAHTELMKLREYDSEDMEGFENRNGSDTARTRISCWRRRSSRCSCSWHGTTARSSLKRRCMKACVGVPS